LSTSDGFSLQGIDLRLPLWLQVGTDSADEETITGGLSIHSVTVPMLPTQSVRLPLEASPNGLSVKSPTTVKIPGGSLELGPVACSGILTDRFAVDTSLTVNNTQISPLLSQIWSEPVEGTIEGRLDPVKIEGSLLKSDGEIKISVFNGAVVVSNLGASGLFSSAPVFKLSGHFNDLSLAEMTTGTSFGRIEGVLKGHVESLEIAYGQPQKFDLLLETVPKKGVSQRVSVKAVENISELGGGGSPFSGLAGVFASLFKEFPYKKMGVRASLQNDVFKINGTIKEGNTEYLVKRGSFSGVNVINQNPDNRVSFKDMVKRMKRVTSSKGGPVVK
jgi:hypothetical protein